MNTETQRLFQAMMGGYESPIISTTGSEVTLPGGCIALLPHSGCIFTSIKSSEDAHNHADATHMNLLTRDLGSDTYKSYPLMVKSPYFWTHATISAGTFTAICI